MAPITTKAHRSASAEALPNVQHISDAPIKDNCMPESSSSAPRKRACSEQHTDKQSEASPPTKSRKRGYSSDPQAAFWDNLSYVHLTKRALRELDRRNTQSNITGERERAEHLRSHDPSAFKDVESFARHGGPDLSDLRNFCEPIHSPSHTTSLSRPSMRGLEQGSASVSTRPTKKTGMRIIGVYDRNFQQHLIDHNIYPHAYTYSDKNVPTKPTNWKDIKDTLAQRRPSLESSVCDEKYFERFVRADANVPKEKQVSETVIPILEGMVEDIRCRSGGIPFTNLDPLTDGTLKFGNPDVYYGARPENLRREVRTELDGRIIPSTQDHLPIAPNFFLAVKGPDGPPIVAERSAWYDGALGARGMESLESYGQGESENGTAYTISSIYQCGVLKMYASYLTQPSSPGGRPSYHMAQIDAWVLTGNADTFRQGVRAYRNARDWAEKQRDNLIRRANEKAALPKAEVTNDIEADASPVAAASDTEAHTKSQEPRTTLNEGSNGLGVFEESDSSAESFAATRVTTTRSNKRKRRSTDVESEARPRAD